MAAFIATGDWEAAAQAAIRAQVTGLLSAAGVTVDEVTAAVNAALHQGSENVDHW